MTTNSTIKWRPTWKVWIPIVLFMIPLILEKEIFGTYFSPCVYGLFVFVIGIIYYFRLKLWQSFAVMTMTTIVLWTYFLAARPERIEEMILLLGLDPGSIFVPWLKTYLTMPIWLVFLIINSIIFYSLGPMLMKAFDLEKSAIRLFKLAAREITDETNGFTDRPYYAGKHSYTRDRIIGLASFLEEKKICRAEFQGSGIRFIFSMGISPLSNKYKDTLSYVDFGDDGSLNVFISERDYKQYKKQYTFSQLCELMGKTFLRFVEYYVNNNEKRIITELKSV